MKKKRAGAGSQKKKIEPIPKGYKALTPYLAVSNADAAIDFYKRVFNARELMRMPGPDGKIGHAELELGGSVLMLADEFPKMGFRAPGSIGGTPVTIHHYVKDVDAVFGQAVAAGAKVRQPLENKFYGDRAGQIEDPFGHVWNVSTHVEDVSPAEMKRRSEAFMKEQAGV